MSDSGSENKIPEVFYIGCSECKVKSPATQFVAWAFYLDDDGNIVVVGRHAICPNCGKKFDYGAKLIPGKGSVKAALTVYSPHNFKKTPTLEEAFQNSRVVIRGNLKGNVVMGTGNSGQKGFWQVPPAMEK